MRSILLTGLLMLPILGFAQSAEGEALLLQQYNNGQDVLTVPDLKKNVRDRINFGVQAGVSFTSFGSHGSMFNSYIAPEIRYQASPKVHFSAGVVLSNSFLPGTGLEGAGMPGSGPAGIRYNRTWVYASGRYQVNPRLTVGGMVAKELDNGLYRDMNAFQKNSGFQSIGMDVNYKITDNIQVGARFNVTDGRPYYYSDPSNPFIRRSPFSPGW